MFSSRNHGNKAYVSLGSNLGDRAGNLLLGVRGMMEAALVVTRLSSIYETEPVSEIEQPRFLNMVAEIGNPLPAPEQVMARLLRVEYALGRTRDIKDGPRTIDLDLLLYGNVESTPIHEDSLRLTTTEFGLSRAEWRRLVHPGLNGP